MPYTLRTQDGIVIRNVPDDAPEEDLRRRVAEVRARRDGGTLPQAVSCRQPSSLHIRGQHPKGRCLRRTA